MIPKILHQTYSRKSALQPALLQNIQVLQERNPDWQHVLYDDDDCKKFIRDAYGQKHLDLYERIDPRYGAARADLFRYLLLYKVGGVYLDIKSTAMHPLSSVIPADTRYLLSRWDNGIGGREEGSGKHSRFGVDSELQQWFIVAEKEHPFLAAVIQKVMHNIETYDAWHGRVGTSGVLRSTGPIAYTLAIEPIMDAHPHTSLDIHTLGFRYTCLENDPKAEKHRTLIPSYRDIRFPVIQLADGDRPRKILYHALAMVIAWLHEATKTGGLRSRIIALKNRYREIRPKRA